MISTRTEQDERDRARGELGDERNGGACENDASEDQVVDLEWQADAVDAIDPIELEITDYLADEMTREEKSAFEEKMRLDPELKRRVDAEREALNALDELQWSDLDNSNVDLIEATVDKLNSETQTELDEALAKRKKLDARAKLAAIVTTVVAIALGFCAFAAVLPSEQEKREADARVVERLAQLEAVGDFDYLKALAAANFLPEWREAWRNFDAENDEKEDENVENNSAASTQRSYQELTQDRVFYRLQRRFEALPEKEQNRWRDLRRQIDRDEDAEKLLQTLDDYSAWLLKSTNLEEREQIDNMTIPERLEEVRKRINESVRFANSLKLRNAVQNGEKNGQGDAQRRDWGAQRMQTNPAQYKNAALRAALPEEFKDEDLTSLAQKYGEYARKRRADDRNLFGAHEGVVQFVQDSNSEELLSNFSEKARNYLDDADPQTRSTLIGLLVSVGYLEEYERRRAPMTRPFQYRNPLVTPFQQRANGESGKVRQDSTKELAETLKKAPLPVRDYILSCPPQEARGLLVGLNWGKWVGGNGRNNAPRMPQNFAPAGAQPFGNMPLAPPRGERPQNERGDDDRKSEWRPPQTSGAISHDDRPQQ